MQQTMTLCALCKYIVVVVDAAATRPTTTAILLLNFLFDTILTMAGDKRSKIIVYYAHCSLPQRLDITQVDDRNKPTDKTVFYY